jgi:hypothetical protein
MRKLVALDVGEELKVGDGESVGFCEEEMIPNNTNYTHRNRKHEINTIRMAAKTEM